MSSCIFFCTQSAHSRGGVETWLDRLTGFLQTKERECIVGLSRANVFHLPAVYRQHHPLLKTVEFDGRSGTQRGRIDSIKRVLRRIRPSVVVVTAMVDALQAIAELKEELDGVAPRCVCVAHGIGANVFSDFRHYAEIIDAGVGISRLGKQLFERWVCLPPDRCFHITNGANPCEPQVANQMGHRTSSRFRVGYVGRLEQYEKQALDIVEVVKALRLSGAEFEFEITGDGPLRSHLETELQSEVRLGIVTFTGWVDENRLRSDIYPVLDAIVNFSPAEGSCPPITIAEAMHFGVVPVMARFLGLNAENRFVDGENCLLFSVSNTADAAEQLQHLISDHELKLRVSNAAREHARQHLDLNLQLNHWKAAIELTERAPLRIATGLRAPNSIPSGRLERRGIPGGIASVLRWTAGRRQTPGEPGAEWPHCSTWPRNIQQQFEETVIAADSEHDTLGSL